VFSVTLLTFLVIVYDRASGLAEGEKKEIGVLKACGWRVGDVIAVKMYEALALSVSAFAAGVTAALFYVYVFDAPVISGLFTGYSLLRPDF
jgi:ABC-type lipoprotein release transport system permease subunit